MSALKEILGVTKFSVNTSKDDTPSISCRITVGAIRPYAGLPKMDCAIINFIALLSSMLKLTNQ
jgi:hypothetical protein